MLCERCKKNTATTHIRTVINGVVTEKNLCGYCAAISGYSHFANNGFASMLASMFGDELALGAVEELKCDCCGTTFSDIADSGKMGCSECYHVFSDKLEPYLRRVHGSATHVGKKLNKSDNLPSTVTPKTKIETLRAELLDAIKKEEFENAAKLRDEIRKLEGGENK